MNKHRKKIILSEIEYWKRNKLLPEQYCDFLITLYAGGSEGEEDQIQVGTSILQKEKRNHSFMILSILLFSAIVAIVLFYLNDGISLIIGGLGIAVLIALALIPNIKKSTIYPFLYISSAFLLLMLSFKIWSLYFSEQPLVLVGFLAVNCILWFVTGRLLKLLYFTLSGILGVIAIIVFLFMNF